MRRYPPGASQLCRATSISGPIRRRPFLQAYGQRTGSFDQAYKSWPTTRPSMASIAAARWTTARSTTSNAALSTSAPGTAAAGSSVPSTAGSGNQPVANASEQSTKPAAQTSTDGLPSYAPPTTGLLSYLPPSLVPYAEVIRLDKPGGTIYLYFPCLFSTFLAAPLLDPMPSPATLLGLNALFLLGSIVFRGAACTWNDTLDRDLDRKVTRTRLRPLARGALSASQGHAFTAAQTALGTGILVAAFPPACLAYALPSVAVIAAYPLMKRVTHYPQLVLGFSWAWGAVMGFPALGIDILAPGNATALWAAGSLYASGICWTMVYDYIYAHQDVRDDVKVGIKSIAVRHEQHTKALLSVFAAAQVGLLAATGVVLGAGPVFYGGAVVGTATVLATMIRRVDLKVPTDCWWWFTWGALFTGGAIGSGCVGEYLMRWSA